MFCPPGRSGLRGGHKVADWSMKLDSSDLSAITPEYQMLQDTDAEARKNAESSKAVEAGESDIVGEHLSGQGIETCPEVGKCTDWHYMFIHHRKVQAVRTVLEKDGRFPVFIHKTVIYSQEKNVKVAHEQPTISGLVFIQGDVKEIKKYLSANLPWLFLVNDCGTGKTAVIPDRIMRPFMRVLEIDPARIRFMLKPISQYGAGNQLLRVTSGILQGMEGYLIRIDKDRRLVMAVGDMTVAISGVHKESFEKAEDYASLLAASGYRSSIRQQISSR